MKLIIKEVIAYINSNISHEMKVEDIAVYFGYSKFHFSREFKRLTGFSVSEYISALKIELSIKELTRNKNSVLGSQLKSGYLSSGTYSSTFSKSTGLSPRQYQRKLIDLYNTLNEYENAEGKIETPYYNMIQQADQSKEFYSCKVIIEVPSHFKKGVVFVGLFQTPIPNHRPIVGKALLKTQQCTLDRIPKGEYYLLVCAIEKSNNPLHYFLLNSCLRGRVEEKVSFPTECEKEYFVKLRDPLPQDPPILVNLPSLLAEVILNRK
ncbi:helix-turn-helix transcriptional regulator [Lacrimispora brassicae]